MLNKFFSRLIGSLLLSFALTGVVSAESVKIDSIVVNHKETVVTVSGSAKAGSVITIKVIRPDGVTEDFVGQTIANADGKYEFTYKLGEGAAEDQRYEVYVFTDDENAALKAMSGFKYYNDVSIARALDLLNSSSASGVSEVIKEKNEVFALPIDSESDYYKLKDKSSVHAAIAGKGFSNLESLRTAFLNAVAIERQLEYEEELRQNAIKRINDASPAEIEKAVADAAEILNIRMNTSSFKGLSDESEAGVFNVMTNTSFVTPEDVSGTFDKAVAVFAVKGGNRESIASVFEEYDNVLMISKNSKYSDMSEDQKANVRKKMVGISFDDINLTTEAGLESALTKISSVFSNAVDAVSDNTSKNTGSGGGGGTQSKKFGTVMLPQDDVMPPKTQNNGSFADINDAPWAKESIEFLAEKNIINGFGGNVFKPNDNVTREQFVKLFVAAFNIPVTDTQMSFSDVKENDWYYMYVSAAVNAGIIKGIDETRFGAGENITRQDMAVIADRTMNYLGITIPETTQEKTFMDKSQIADYASEAVRTMQMGGIINGISDDEFAPELNCTRAMAAKVIFELYSLVDRD